MTESQQEIVVQAQGKGASSNKNSANVVTGGQRVSSPRHAQSHLRRTRSSGRPTACSPALTHMSDSLSRRTSQGQSQVQDPRTIRGRCQDRRRGMPKALVKLVRATLAKQVEEEDVDLKNMAVLEFQKHEMEWQVEILRLEKDPGAARYRLGAIRRAGYHTDKAD